MSDTPRTDAVYNVDLLDRSIQEHGRTWGWGVVSDFRELCRQLERELASATKGSLELEEERDELDREFQDLERRWKDSESRLKKLQHAMSFASPRCDSLHHPKKYQHEITEQCPVEELIRKAKDL